MPQYIFRDREGTVRRVVARDLADAAVRASETFGEDWRIGAARPRTVISDTERMWLWRQLSALLVDGVALGPALAQISESAATGPARVAAARLADLCAQGLSLSEALAAVPGIADDEQVAFVAAAERAGRLADGVAVLAELIETDTDTSADLALRWLYPAAVAFFGLVVLPLFAVLARGTIPTVSGRLWQDLGFREADIGFTDVLWQWLTRVPLLALVVAAAIFVFVLLARRAGSRANRAADRLLYVFPGYGAFRFHKRLAIFFRALALGRSAGLPDCETLALARPTLGELLSAHLLPAQVATEEGQPIARALASIEWLPETARSRLLSATPASFAEAAEALAREHRRLADYYARRFVTIAEPAMVIIVALAVGAIAVATFGPVVRLITVISQLSQ